MMAPRDASPNTPPPPPPRNKQTKTSNSSSHQDATAAPPRKTTDTTVFQPYYAITGTTREAPMFYMILEPLLACSCVQAILASLYRVRWCLSHPLRTRLLPQWIPVVPGCSALLNLTVGQLILTVPLIVWFILGYSATFVAPNIADSGYYAAYAVFYVFLTANKTNSIFSVLFGIPFERLIFLHNVSSAVAVVLGCFHLYVCYKYSDDSVFGKAFPETANLGKFLGDGATANLSGTCTLGFLMGLVGLSLLPILRRVLFNLWLCSHILLTVGVIVGLFWHSVTSAVFVTAWWGLDLLVRYGVMAGCRYRCQARLRRIGQEHRKANEPAIEIKFRKPPGFDYNAGQFVQIALPAISVMEFHPVSISSAPHEDYVTLHVRQLGNWTSKLVALTDDTCSEKWTTTAEIWMEGPYGALSVDLDNDKRYQTALFVSGGIGVTPCQSISKSLLYQHRALGRSLKYMKFVWAVRDIQMVNDIPPPLGGGENFSQDSKLFRRQSELIRRSSTLESLDNNNSKKDNTSTATGPSSSSNSNKPIREPRRRSTGKKLPATVQVDIYCTRDNHGDNNDEEEDAALPYNLHRGRPDIDQLFLDTKQRALEMGEHNVAVFGCGPVPLMNALQAACRRHSPAVVGCGEGVFFDLHTEHFEF